MMRRSAVLVAMILLSPSALSGQGTSNASPTEVAREFFTAQMDGRWIDAARLLDLWAFEPYRQDAIRNSRLSRGVVGPTPEQVMAETPDMPRAVAEYVARKYSQAADSDALSLVFARTSSADVLAGMPADQAAARWLEARDPRWTLERSIAHLPAGCLRPKVETIPKPRPVEVVGNAITAPAVSNETDSVSYVLFRDVATSPSSRIGDRTPPGVLTLLRANGQWRILPLPDVGFTAGVRNNPSFGCVHVSVQPSK